MRTHVRAIPFRRFDRGGQLRQSEVEDLGVAVGTQHDVLGLDIAMHETTGMRCRQSTCELDTDVHDIAYRQRAPLQTVPKRLTLDELRDQVRALLDLAEIVD